MFVNIYIRQVISNLVATLDGDRAKASCYLLNVITRHGQSRLLAPGRYECDLARIGGQWPFQRSRVILDHDVVLEGGLIRQTSRVRGQKAPPPFQEQ